MTDDRHLIRAAIAQARRARRAEAEVDRVHDWIADGCPAPTPARPGWAPRRIHTRFNPPYSQLEES